MTLVVQKFGGTSLATVPHILSVAKTIAKAREQGEQVVVVVSAMAGVTDQLVTWCTDILGTAAGTPEYDAVLSTGECVTAGLLSLALQRQGILSRSWTASQLPIRSNGHHGSAVIEEIPVDALKAFAAQGGVSVITGFQGLGPDHRVTTLGRGGSDTTAVALASFLGAQRCDIFTDVEGVFTADPRLVKRAQKITHLSYEEMLSLSLNGAKVLHPQSVDIAKRHGIPLRVLSSFSFEPGTLISMEGAPGSYLFGLTYTTGWQMASSSHPFAEDAGYESQEMCVLSDTRITYKAIFSALQGELFREKGPQPPHREWEEKLASIAILTGACTPENLGNLHGRLLKTLSSPQMPPVQLCATQSQKWQIWVQEQDLPQALGLIHSRLQEGEDVEQ